MTGTHEVAYEVAKIGRRVTLRPGKMVLQESENRACDYFT